MDFGLNSLIADSAAKHLQGIPWGELEKTAPIVGGKRKPLYSEKYVTQYMYPAFEKAKVVVDQLDFSGIQWDSEEALEAYAKMKEALELVEGGVIEAIQRGATQLTAAAMRFDTLTLKMYILSLYLTALNSLIRHEYALPQDWANQAPTLEETEQRESEVMDQAALTVTMFETIVKLDEFHVLGPIKKGASLGLWPLAVIAVLAVAAVAAIALIAWGLVSLKDVSAKNEILRDMCLKAKDTSTQKKCVDVSADTKPDIPFGDTLKEAGKWLAIGGVVLAGIYFLPMIVSKVGQARKAAHSS